MRLILFDWDGTIVDSMPALYLANREICLRMGLPFDMDVFSRCFSPNWRLMYRQFGIPDERVEEAVQIWAENYRPELSPPFEGVCEALSELLSAGFVLGIVTGSYRQEVEPQFARIGLDDVLTVHVCGDETEHGKPDPEPLMLAIERAGMTPSDTIYVGDALDDMRMARATGVAGVGIVSQFADESALLAAGASETAESVAQWVARRRTELKAT